MAQWDDGIVCEEVWRDQALRLLIVCPEPNEVGMERLGDGRCDMRDLLRRPEPRTLRKQFYVYLRQAVRAVYSLSSRTGPGEEQDHKDLMCRIAFIDLKNTGGGRNSDRAQIVEAARTRQCEIVEQIGSMGPTHIAVAGEKAQAAFDRYIASRIPPGAKVFKIYHPSRWEMSAQGYYDHVYVRFHAALTGEHPQLGHSTL